MEIPKPYQKDSSPTTTRSHFEQSNFKTPDPRLVASHNVAAWNQGKQFSTILVNTLWRGGIRRTIFVLRIFNDSDENLGSSWILIFG